MKLAVISFTKHGSRICHKLVKRFVELGEEADGYVQKRFFSEYAQYPGLAVMEESLESWTKERFSRMDGLIYIGAAGIAVRAIAPCIQDKLTDPAVVVVDEQGRFAISLLSGHVGGANRLAAKTAEILGAVPVITTASEVQGVAAVDVWAQEHQLTLSDRRLAKETAAALVNGEAVGFYSDYRLADPFPEEYARGQICRYNVWISAHTWPRPESTIALFLPGQAQLLRLIPKSLTVGIGCRKGTASDQIRQAVLQTLARYQLEARAVARIASIDIKKQERGIELLAEEWGIGFSVFSAEELNQVEGAEAESAFVRQVTGTGNVCERAALLSASCLTSRPGRLLVPKQVVFGVTVAVAEAPLVIGAEG